MTYNGAMSDSGDQAISLSNLDEQNDDIIALENPMMTDSANFRARSYRMDDHVIETRQSRESSLLLPDRSRLNCCQNLTDICKQKVKPSNQQIICISIGWTLLVVVIGLAVGVSTSSFGSSNQTKPLTKSTESPVTYDASKPWTYYRLPENIKPVSYDLDIRPHFYNDKDSYFQGHVTIEAQVNLATRFVLLHAKGVNISSSSLKYSNQTRNRDLVVSIPPDNPFDYVVLSLDENLKANRTIVIDLEFVGSLAFPNEGFYKAPFRVPGTEEKLYAAVTHFEPMGARRAFPCMDEPNLKAHFTVAIHHKAEVVAYSNMPLASKEPTSDEDLPFTSRFVKTNVAMSTYLVAFAIGPYQEKPPCKETTKRLQICAIAPDYMANQLNYSLDTAVQGLTFLEEFFDIDFPLPKLDLIIYPQDRGRAMENWGLISFVDRAFLVSQSSTDSDKNSVSGTTLHELSHQWFGNLVTLEWWDDLWLNEGFASYLKYPAALSLGRQLEAYLDYLSAISADGYRSTHPIRAVGIETDDDVQAAFDSITYKKGMSTIRMLVHAMGMENFRSGARLYMQRHKFANAKTADLWEALSNFSSYDITNFMNTWVNQKGYPLVSVELNVDRQKLILRQKRFVFPEWHPSKQTAVANELPERWHIPIVYRTSPNANTTTAWFKPESDQFSIGSSDLQGSTIEDLKLNVEQAAYLRVNYPSATWDRFGDKLLEDVNSLSPLDRAGLLDDSFTLARGGELPYEQAFRLARFMTKETHPIVWGVFTSQVTFLRNALADSMHYDRFENLTLGIMRSARKTLATLGLATLAFQRENETQCYAAYYKQGTWNKTENLDLRTAILLADVLSNDTEANINRLLQMRKETKIVPLRSSILLAFTRTKYRWMIERELNKIFSGELSPSDFVKLASHAAYSRETRLLMWNWARENFQKLKPRFGGSTRYLYRWIVEIPSDFNTEEQYQEFEDFVQKEGDFGVGEHPKDKAMEAIRTNIFWRQNLRKGAEKGLESMADFIADLANTPVKC